MVIILFVSISHTAFPVAGLTLMNSAKSNCFERVNQCRSPIHWVKNLCSCLVSLKFGNSVHRQVVLTCASLLCWLNSMILLPLESYLYEDRMLSGVPNAVIFHDVLLTTRSLISFTW